VARQLYGGEAAAVEWIDSDQADVFRLVLADGRADRIVKVQRECWEYVVRREQTALPVLRGMGLTELPLIEFTQDDLPGCELPFMTMPATPSRPLDEIYASSPVRARAVVERIGGFMSRLRRVPWERVPGVQSPATKVIEHGGSLWRALAPLAGHPLCRGQVAAVATELLRLARQEPRDFGGIQGLQVLTDGEEAFTWIDWSELGPVWAMYDLAWALRDLDRFGPDAPSTLEAVLLGAYCEAGRLTTAERLELSRWLALLPLHLAARAIGDGDEGTARLELARAAAVARAAADGGPVGAIAAAARGAEA
jgi:hypothetical protein